MKYVTPLCRWLGAARYTGHIFQAHLSLRELESWRFSSTLVVTLAMPARRRNCRFIKGSQMHQVVAPPQATPVPHRTYFYYFVVKQKNNTDLVEQFTDFYFFKYPSCFSLQLYFALTSSSSLGHLYTFPYLKVCSTIPSLKSPWCARLLLCSEIYY